MRWSPWASSRHGADANETSILPLSSSSSSSSIASSLRPDESEPAPTSRQSWPASLRPETVVAAGVLTTTFLVGRHLYRTYARRIPTAKAIPPSWFRRRSLLGVVTSVGDGDGFRFYHTPGGRLLGWGWLPGRKIPRGRDLSNQTISVRLAGIDAPECAHFGRPAQPGAIQAMTWLTKYVEGRRVRVRLLLLDRFERAIGVAHVRRGLLRRDVAQQLLLNGWGTIYTDKKGPDFGDQSLEGRYCAAESKAQQRYRGIWAGDPADFESPREYKNRYFNGQSK